MIFKMISTRAAAWTLAPLAAAGLATAVPAIAQSANALASVQAHLKSTSSMTADFVQTDRNGQRLTGKLTLKRPGKIRFQYQKDVPLLIVGDGSRLTMIDYQVKQVQSWPVKNSPLGALLDPDRDLSKYAKVLPTGSGTSRRIRMDTLAVKSTASIDVTSPMSAPYSRTFAFDGRFSASVNTALRS